MALYSIARRVTNFTTAQAAHTLVTAATDRAALLEAGIFIAATAVASVYGLGRPAAAGVTAASPVTVLAEDPGEPAGTVTSVLSWTTSPTDPTNYLRRIGLPATVGTGVIWTFPRGVRIAISSNLVVQNIGTTGAADMYFVVDE